MTTPAPILAFGSDNPVDLLVNAGSVVTLLREMAPHFCESSGHLGLGEEAANGLALVLACVEETISVALQKL